MTTAAAYTTAQAAASGRAVASLVLGILGLVVLPLLSPLAWWLGHCELEDIRLFRAPRAGEGLARAGQVLGIIGTLPLLLVAAALLLCVPVLVLVLLFG
jgi:hypothetical protein